MKRRTAEVSLGDLVIPSAKDEMLNHGQISENISPIPPSDLKYFDKLMYVFTSQNLPEHSILRFLRSLEGSKAELTLKCYHTQVMNALRDFLYVDYNLPSPQFDDVAALLMASELCRRADKKDKEGKLSPKAKAELNERLSSIGEMIPLAAGKQHQVTDLELLLPEFKFSRSNGRLHMKLRGDHDVLPRSEIRRDDEHVLNIILDRLDKDKKRSLWPHLFKMDVVGHVLGIAKNERDNSATTVNLRHSALKAFEVYLFHSGELGNPAPIMHYLSRARTHVQQRKVLTEKQIENMLEYAEEKADTCEPVKDWMHIRNYALLTLLDWTWLRAGALCNIKTSEINADDATLYVPHEKGDKSRFFDLNPKSTEAVRAYLPVRDEVIELHGLKSQKVPDLFVSRGIEPFDRRHLDDVVDNIARAVGIRPPPEGRHGPHELRHSMATLLYVKSGGDIGLVQHRLGHASPATTMRYISTGFDSLNSAKFKKFHPRAN